MVADRMTSGIDALLLVSFGGPEAPEEVVPFLQRVTAGRNIPEERLRLVGQHYFDRGGVSPINGLCRDLLTSIQMAFDEAGIDLAVYWGNRNSAPFLDDTVAKMAADGVQHALAFVTSAFSSYSGCRQYRENIEAAQNGVDGAPVIDKLRVFFNHPGFIEPLVDGLAEALRSRDVARTKVFFTAHSIPQSLADSSRYVEQLMSACELITADIECDWSLVWQSRSGPPTMPWLEPDIVDAIKGLDPGVTDRVVVVPVGFVSDHMEVLQDLDTDAAAAASEIGLAFDRVTTSGTDRRFVQMIVDLVNEKLDGTTPVALGPLGLVPEQCGLDCCPAPVRRPQ